MSGHAGFLPIGNNIPHPSVNSVPVVDGNENAGNSVNNVQVGGEPQPPAEVPVRAADIGRFNGAQIVPDIGLFVQFSEVHRISR